MPVENGPAGGGGCFSLLESPEELSRLESSLEKFYPHSLQMLNILLLKRLDKFPPSVKISLYLYGDNFEDPFLVSIQQPNFHATYGVVTYTRQPPTPAMMEAFDSLISWDESPCFPSNQNSFAPLLKSLLDSRANSSKYSEGIPGALYAINRHLHTSLESPDVPPHLSLSPLSPSSASKVVDSWRYAEAHSGDVAAACSCPGCLPSAGVFLRSSGDLVSSAFFSPLGTINVLHTEESHRRRGLGCLTLRGLSASVAALNARLTPAAEIEPWNSASTRLFQNCGFSYVCDIIWYYYSQ